mgnify:CR=1 FL=1
MYTFLRIFYTLIKVFKIDIKHQFENVQIDEKLATKMKMVTSNVGNLATLTGCLNATDNQFRLERLPKDVENDDEMEIKGGKIKKLKVDDDRKDRYGQMDVTKMVNLLSSAGIGNVHLEPRLRGTVIRAVSLEILFKFLCFVFNVFLFIFVCSQPFELQSLSMICLHIIKKLLSNLMQLKMRKILKKIQLWKC